MSLVQWATLGLFYFSLILAYTRDNDRKLRTMYLKYSSACSPIFPKLLVVEGCGEDGFGVRACCTVDRRPAAAKDREGVYSRWWSTPSVYFLEIH